MYLALCANCRYPKEDANVSNISIVVTNVGADFTKLGSFNPPQAFGESLWASTTLPIFVDAAGFFSSMEYDVITANVAGETLVNTMDRSFLKNSKWGNSADMKLGVQV